ncbi:hypothetical protein [Komagataeibacter diospyri]|uniref:hypothetical protein n=1 Tax=Komagataeibacter diospyri TaxID=1932662 RepID=UPI001396BE68|nr:hypothetical protein [Komagataeibacter diospyri]
MDRPHECKERSFTSQSNPEDICGRLHATGLTLKLPVNFKDVLDEAFFQEASPNASFLKKRPHKPLLLFSKVSFLTLP